jgi:hypothetical protein
MNSATFTDKDLYQYYKKRREESPIYFTSFFFNCLLASKVKKLAAKDGEGMRCILLYLMLDGETHILSRCGDVRKLKARRPAGIVVESFWSKTKDLHKTAIRILEIRKARTQPSFPGILSWTIVNDNGFFRATVVVNLKDRFELVLCKYLFEGKSAVNLCLVNGEMTIENEVIVSLLITICQELGGDVLLICDDTLPGCAKYSDDFRTIWRTEKSRCFIAC